MKDEDWAEADALFQAALDVEPAGREAWLDRQCADAGLRARVARLLRHADSADAFLPEAGALREELLDALGEVPPPVALDGYRWIRRIGEGGMGEVWEAEQLHPVRRRVAVKLVRRGLESAAVLSRFESERQALARMSHPNIAQVYDAGTSGDGRPYFVMEFVDGEPITTHARRLGLGIEERLRMFLDVCDGVEHAHHKGVIHRDLKPSNVLVSGTPGRSVPKIIDFGIARAVDPSGSERTLLTEHGQIVGTPDYMSPEQAAGDDVDTRADVYGLGATLFELLTQTRPYEDTASHRPSVPEMLRRIREVDPPRPSRRVDDVSVSRRLRGDLDWIVTKALEKDRGRRYSSPNELADDVRRHLRHEPVVAGPPSATYRLSKLIQRHRIAVTAAVAVALALFAGAMAATWQAVRATRAERAALEQARTAEQVVTYLVGLFESADPANARGNVVDARQLLDRGRRKIREELAEQPLVRSRLEVVLGDIHTKLGMASEARQLLEDAVATRRSLLGAGHPDTGLALHGLARAQASAGDDAASEASYLEAIRVLEQALGPDDVAVWEVRLDFAEVVRRRGRFQESEAMYRGALEALARLRGPEHPAVARAWNGLGTALYRLGRFVEAEQAFRNALALKERLLGPDHYEVAMTLSSLSGCLGQLGKDGEAEGIARRAVAIYEKVFGDTHNLLAGAWSNLAAVYGRQGRYAESEAAFLRAAAIRERLFGPDHPETANIYKNLGALHARTGEAAKARTELGRALKIDEAAYGGKGERVAWCLNVLGEVERRFGSLDLAESYYRRALAAIGATGNVGLPDGIRARRGLALLARERGRLGEAEAGLRANLAETEALGAEHPDVPNVLDDLAETVLARGDVAEAERLLERSLAIRRKTQREGSPDFGATYARLSAVRLAQGNREEAERLAIEAERLALIVLPAQHPDVVRARMALERARQGVPNSVPNRHDGMQKSVSVGTSAAPTSENPRP